MSATVLATPAAEAAAKKMNALLTGDITARLREIRHQLQVLSQPDMWDGPDAVKFRSEWQQPLCRGVDRTVEQMERLARHSAQIVENILRAGGDGSAGPAPQPGPSPQPPEDEPEDE